MRWWRAPARRASRSSAPRSTLRRGWRPGQGRGRSTGRATHRGRSPPPARYAGLSHGKRVAQLFEDLAEGGIWEPTFIIDFPVEISPLAKTRPQDPSTAERFELYAAGMEIANGFSELNDPLEQRQRFLDQLAEREK